LIKPAGTLFNPEEIVEEGESYYSVLNFGLHRDIFQVPQVFERRPPALYRGLPYLGGLKDRKEMGKAFIFLRPGEKMGLQGGKVSLFYFYGQESLLGGERKSS
jgi:hypothetical protein